MLLNGKITSLRKREEVWSAGDIVKDGPYYDVEILQKDGCSINLTVRGKNILGGLELDSSVIIKIDVPEI